MKILYQHFRFDDKINTTPKKEEKHEEQTKRVVNSCIIFFESRFLLRFYDQQPLIHQKYVTIKEQTKKNQSCMLGFLVRVDFYPIYLHLKKFLETNEPYFTQTSFKKIIAL